MENDTRSSMNIQDTEDIGDIKFSMEMGDMPLSMEAEVTPAAETEAESDTASVTNLAKLMLQKPDFCSCNKPVLNNVCFMAMDIGSTHQRVVTFTPDWKEQSDVIVMDTAYNQLPDDVDTSNCSSASGSITDNLEMVITCKNPTSKTAIKSARVVKHSLMKRLNRPERSLTADASKVDSSSTYVNIICNAAVTTLLQRVKNEEIVSADCNVDLTISLPPDDANLKARTDACKERLEGIYEVEFIRLGITVTVIFEAQSIFTGSEPLGAALYQIMSDDFDEEQTCAFLDCGGRSSGVILFNDGLLMEASSYSFATGGSSLLNTLADKIASEVGIQRPRIDVLLKTLNTGIYKDGGKPIDVSKCIEEAKKDISESLYNGLSQATALNNLQATDLEHIYCSGRTFGETIMKNKSTGAERVASDSICNYLAKLNFEKSPNTKFVRVVNESAVVAGMMYVRLNNIK